MGEGIVPLCVSCNTRGGIVLLKPGILIASAHKADTCERVSRPELRVG